MYRINFGNGQVLDLGAVSKRVAQQALAAQHECDRRFGSPCYGYLERYLGQGEGSAYAAKTR